MLASQMVFHCILACAWLVLSEEDHEQPLSTLLLLLQGSIVD